MVTQPKRTPKAASKIPQNDGITPIRMLVRSHAIPIAETIIRNNGNFDYSDVGIQVRDILSTYENYCQYFGDLVYALTVEMTRTWASNQRDRFLVGERHVQTWGSFQQKSRDVKWMFWTENCEGTQKSLLKMRYHDFIMAIATREQRAQTELKRAGFLGRIAERVKSEPDTPAGDILSDEELQELYDQNP